MPGTTGCTRSGIRHVRAVPRGGHGAETLPVIRPDAHFLPPDRPSILPDADFPPGGNSWCNLERPSRSSAHAVASDDPSDRHHLERVHHGTPGDPTSRTLPEIRTSRPSARRRGIGAQAAPRRGHPGVSRSRRNLPRQRRHRPRPGWESLVGAETSEECRRRLRPGHPGRASTSARRRPIATRRRSRPVQAACFGSSRRAAARSCQPGARRSTRRRMPSSNIPSPRLQTPSGGSPPTGSGTSG